MPFLISRVLFWSLLCVITLVCAINFAVMGIDYVMLYHGLNPVIAAPLTVLSLMAFIGSAYAFVEDFHSLLNMSDELSDQSEGE